MSRGALIQIPEQGQIALLLLHRLSTLHAWQGRNGR